MRFREYFEIIKNNPRKIIIEKKILMYFFSFILGAGLIFGSYFFSVQQIDFSKFASYGYVGVFLACLLGSATVFFPVPHLATVIAAGFLFNPFLVAFFAGVGCAIGELSGFFVGFSTHKIVKDKSRWFSRISFWMKSYGGATILILSSIPNPFFDLVSISAGVMRYSIFRFMMFVFVGRFIRSFVLIYFVGFLL